MERKLEKHPQKDGIITIYKCGFICVGGWSSRIEKWEEFRDSPIGKYIVSCESEINRLKELLSQVIRDFDEVISDNDIEPNRAGYLTEAKNYLSQNKH